MDCCLQKNIRTLENAKVVGPVQCYPWTGKASGEIVVTTLLPSGWPCKLGPERQDAYHVAS